MQAAGVAVAGMLVGGLLLSIRSTTERRRAEHAVALAAANGRLPTADCRLPELNRIDPLTGLADRRFLDATLASAWARAVPVQRSRRSLSGRPVTLAAT